MTLFDLYEPLFQYICILNRIARKGSNEAIELATLRPEIIALLEGINKRAQAEPLLALQAGKLEMPITFFVDSIIAESNLRCAGQWHKERLAYDRNELAGDEKFFDLLDETLNDPSPEATERLVIFYVCLGLGFTGWYANQPEYLRRKTETIAKRIGVEGLERVAHICPEAYKYVDSRNLIEPASSKIGAIALAFLALTLVALAVNFYLFRVGLVGLTESLEEILRHDLMK
ncbi:MAG TPA: DotU family type IV/VI secretion system protein [Terrimicrobiaceae bacterium]|nr:DotU family type IV/VI secretion system protein [Terrimicrobiaceae bacterium]